MKKKELRMKKKEKNQHHQVLLQVVDKSVQLGYSILFALLSLCFQEQLQELNLGFWPAQCGQ